MMSRSLIGLLSFLLTLIIFSSGCDTSRNTLSEVSWLSPPEPECDPCEYLDSNGYCVRIPMCSNKESCCPAGTNCCSKNPEKPTVCCPDFTYCTTAGEKYGAPSLWNLNICGIERCDKEPYTKYCEYGSGACCKEDQECSYRIKKGIKIPVCTYPSCPEGTSSCGKPTEEGNSLCCSTANEKCVTPLLRTPYCEKVSCEKDQTLCSSTGNFKGTNFCCTKDQSCFVDDAGLAHCV